MYFFGKKKPKKKQKSCDLLLSSHSKWCYNGCLRLSARSGTTLICAPPAQHRSHSWSVSALTRCVACPTAVWVVCAVFLMASLVFALMATGNSTSYFSVVVVVVFLSFSVEHMTSKTFLWWERVIEWSLSSICNGSFTATFALYSAACPLRQLALYLLLKKEKYEGV